MKKIKRICQLCKKEYVITGYRQKYCEKCIPINDRKLLNKTKKKYYEKNKIKWRKYKDDWRKKNKEKYQAQYFAYNNVKIPKEKKCQICKINKAQERHHKDYSKPYDVTFVCRKCHRTILNKLYKGE